MSKSLRGDNVIKVIKNVALAIFKRIPDTYRRRLFYRLARDLHVSMIEIEGRNGRITGHVEDDIFSHYVLANSWAPAICGIADRVLRRKPGGTFLDIGANIGLTLIPVARIPSIRCLAFEPEPRNFELLEMNIGRNRLRSTPELFNVAVLDVNGTIDFELSASNFGDHRVRRQLVASSEVFHEAERQTIAVRARPLDEMVDASRLRDPVVVKVDTQGAEQHIYAGGRAVFARADVLVIEYWPYGIGRMGGDPQQLIRFIEADYRYGCFIQEGRIPSSTDLAAIDDIAEAMRRLAEPKEISVQDINTHDLVFVKDPSILAA